MEKMAEPEITQRDMKDRLELEDVLPAKPEFSLKSTGKTYSLRIINLQDRTDFSKMFGSWENIAKAFSDKDWLSICRIAYKLMDDKKDFLAGEAEIIDDDGVPRKQYLTGPEKLLRAIQGLMEAAKIMGAINVSVAESEPLLGEHMKREMKKKVAEMNERTGDTYSTSSPASTVTPLSNSDSSP